MEVSKEALVSKNIETHENEECLETDHKDQKVTQEGVTYGEYSIEENMNELPSQDSQIEAVFEEEYPERLEFVIVKELME